MNARVRAPVMVDIIVRVVPTGVEKRGDSWVATATLALLPRPGGEERPVSSEAVPLDSWPSAIATRIKSGEIYLLADSVPTELVTKPAPRSPDDLIPICVKPRFGHARRETDPIDSLWQTVMEVDDWNLLIDALANSQRGASVGPLLRAPNTEPGSETISGSVPDVLSFPRGDTSLLYGLERAREVVRAMQGKRATCKVASCHADTRGRVLEPARFTFRDKPWLGLGGPIMRFAQATATDAPLPGMRRGTATQADILAQERREQDSELRQKMKGKAQVTDELHRARKEFLEERTVAGSVEALRKHAALRATSLSPAECLRACGLSRADADLEQLKDQTKATHALGTLPDLDEFGDPIIDPFNAFEDVWARSVQSVNERFNFIQSMPSLARLFNFVVDVEFDLELLMDRLAIARPYYLSGCAEENVWDIFARDDNESPENTSLKRAHYLFLAGFLGGRAPDFNVWSLTKLRLSVAESDRLDEAHFWACTQEEVLIRLADGQNGTRAVQESGGVAQFDGVVDLGISTPDGLGGRSPRYDLSSLDTINAVESDMQFERRVQAFVQTEGASQAGEPALGVHTRRSSGLVLIDRWRHDHVISQIATTRNHLNDLASSNSQTVLDAEQLTTGYRLDVGLYTGGKRRAWRSLVHRKITFGDPPGFPKLADATKPLNSNWIEEAIDRLYGIDRKEKNARKRRMMVERRVRADGATIALASRLKRNASSGERVGRTTAFAEEIVATWQGDPMGVECIDVDHYADACGTAESNGKATLGFQMDSAVLDLGIEYDLDLGDHVYQPPRLRYGWPYHVGMRPVYLGGAVLPLEYAIWRYEKNFETGLALPHCSDGSVGRRCLRHERIEAPTLSISPLILQGLRLENDRALKEGGETLPAGSADFILLKRRVKGKPDDAFPSSSFRVFTPPILPLHDAALHGVLDGRPVETVTYTIEKKIAGHRMEKTPIEVRRPTDGLKQIDFSAKRGGFPHLELRPDKTKVDSGPAIFRLAEGAGARRTPFYPDPAAQTWVIKVRRTESEDYLEGVVWLPVYPKHLEWPEVAPLALQVSRRDEPRESPAHCINDLYLGSCSAALGEKGELTLKSSKGLRLQCAMFALAPGEDFEFEVWCAPSKAKLHQIFDIVENVALLLAADSADGEFTSGSINQVCRQSFERNFPNHAEFLAALKQTQEPSPYCGPGNMLLPHKDLMEAIAGAICQSLRSHPMPELAATSRIRAVHAVDIPLVRPRFSDLRIVRVQPATLNAVIGDECGDDDGKKSSFSEITARKADVILRNPDWDELSDDGATGPLFGGTIEIDLLSVSDVELRATLVSPTSPIIDDPRKGRSADDMAKGLWPPCHKKTDAIGKGETVSSKASSEASAVECCDDSIVRFNDTPVERYDPAITKRLFGFSVALDGRVTLPRQTATLLTLRDLRDQCIAARSGQLRQIDLLKEQRQTGAANTLGGCKIPEPEEVTLSPPTDPANRVCRVERVHPFTDPVARRMTLTLATGSRFANVYAPSDIDRGYPDAAVQTSEPVCLWLPATRRPDRIAPRSLLPAFCWSAGTPRATSEMELFHSAQIIRDVRIRVRIRRPWFTSGEGERLGIVLWPPRLLADDMRPIFERQLGNDLLPAIGADRFIPAGEEFSDANLGAGGPFITRWGADPIREGPPPQGWLMPPSAFLDFPSSDSDAAIFVPSALMPIPRGDDVDKTNEPGTDGKGGTTDQSTTDKGKLDENQREYMTVSLLTYEPRFDPDYELWYVDVAIDSKRVPEPFLRLGLVRYQEHARCDLQVSEPVTEWIQVLPKRTVCVWEERCAEPTPGGLRRRRIGISVDTPADYGLSFEGEVCASDAVSRAPFMHAYVIRTDTMPDGGRHQTVVAPFDNPSDPCTRLPPRRNDKGTAWSNVIDFVDVEAGENARYAVFLEEVETFLPATFPNEPEKRGKADGAVESGPRFAAWLDIEPLPSGTETICNPSSPASQPKKHRGVTPKPAKRRRKT